MPRRQIDLPDRTGVIRHYEGVLLSDVLALVQPIVPSQAMHAENRLVVRVTGLDGFATSVSYGEISTQLAVHPAMLVDTMDGQLIGLDSGPIRLMMPSDLLPQRGVKAVVEIAVHFF